MHLYHYHPIALEVIARKKGQSSLQEAASMSGQILLDTTSGQVYVPSQSSEILFGMMSSPRKELTENKDIQYFWSRNEENQRKNAIVAKKICIDLFRILTHQDCRILCSKITNLFIKRYQISILVSIVKIKNLPHHQLQILLPSKKISNEDGSNEAFAFLDKNGVKSRKEIRWIQCEINNCLNKTLNSPIKFKEAKFVENYSYTVKDFIKNKNKCTYIFPVPEAHSHAMAVKDLHRENSI